MNVIGDVADRDAIILDDMVDTAGTLAKAAEALGNAGAHNVYACCTHAVLSGSAVDKLNASNIKKLYVTDTVPTQDKLELTSKLQVESIAPLLGEAISRIYREVSVSELFL
jgi:ribose-phosphate pyrophosphokinase